MKTQKVQNISNLNSFSNNYIILTLIILVSVSIIVRIRTLAAPLERDEGEYAYAGQLMLQGIPPYSLAYNMKMPGIYAAYALILAVFGQTQSAIHFGVLIVNTATILILFLMTKKLLGTVAGLAAAVFFAIASMSNRLAATANAENFVLLFAIAGIILLMKFTDILKISYLIFGSFLLGVGFMMKQHGSAFILFGIFFVIWKLFSKRSIDWKKIVYVFSIYSFFAVLPFLITCLILWYCGVFDKFWFWTFEYARYYVSINTFNTAVDCLKENLSRIFPALVLILVFSLTGLLSIFWNREIRKQSFFIVSFLLFSLLAICPGFYFRPHYFLLLLPAIVISAGAGISAINDLLRIYIKSVTKMAFISIKIIIIVWLLIFYTHRNYFLETNPSVLTKYVFGGNPFFETLKIADFIKSISNKDDKIVVFGSEPEIYFYSQRRSATSYIYTYALMEKQPFAMEMQKEMINQIESNKPKFIVIMRSVYSWLLQPYSQQMVFNWAQKYFPAHYRQIGLVEMFADKETTYRWDSMARHSHSKSDEWIMIMERID